MPSKNSFWMKSKAPFVDFSSPDNMIPNRPGPIYSTTSSGGRRWSRSTRGRTFRTSTNGRFSPIWGRTMQEDLLSSTKQPTLRWMKWIMKNTAYFTLTIWRSFSNPKWREMWVKFWSWPIFRISDMTTSSFPSRKETSTTAWSTARRDSASWLRSMRESFLTIVGIS